MDQTNDESSADRFIKEVMDYLFDDEEIPQQEPTKHTSRLSINSRPYEPRELSSVGPPAPNMVYPTSPMAAYPRPPIKSVLEQIAFNSCLWRIAPFFVEYPVIKDHWIHPFKLPDQTVEPKRNQWLFTFFPERHCLDMVPYFDATQVNSVAYLCRHQNVIMAKMSRVCYDLSFSPDIKQLIFHIESLSPTSDTNYLLSEVLGITKPQQIALFEDGRMKSEVVLSETSPQTNHRITLPFHCDVKLEYDKKQTKPYRVCLIQLEEKRRVTFWSINWMFMGNINSYLLAELAKQLSLTPLELLFVSQQ